LKRLVRGCFFFLSLNITGASLKSVCIHIEQSRKHNLSFSHCDRQFSVFGTKKPKYRLHLDSLRARVLSSLEIRVVIVITRIRYPAFPLANISAINRIVISAPFCIHVKTHQILLSLPVWLFMKGGRRKEPIQKKHQVLLHAIISLPSGILVNACVFAS